RDATTTTVANANAPFSSAAQSVTLTATVASSPPGVAINEGTVNFTVTQGGGPVIGTPVTSATFSGGVATAVYTLPAGQAGGVYTVTAVYTPGGDFTTSMGTGTLTVTAGTLAINPATLPNGTVGVPYSQQLAATGGSGTGYTFSAPPASLPPGLTLTAAGLLAGTPTVAGPFTFTVTATDSASNMGSQQYTVTIAPAGTVTLSSLAVTAPGSLGSPASMKVGQTARFTATATLSDGTTVDVTGQAQWNTSNPAVATVDDGSNPSSTPATRGTVTGVAGGSATLTASYTLNGVTRTGSTSVTVTTPVLTGVQPQPAPAGRPGVASVPTGQGPAPAPAPPSR
ncbi:MAG: Ig-like domain-containing protein, partial [Thermomicrobiales bacterium]